MCYSYKGFRFSHCYCGHPEKQWLVYWGMEFLKSFPTKEEAMRYCDENPKGVEYEYHRNPTPYEIKFGYGATHYLKVPESVVLKKDGTIKKWFRHTDGLRYYR